MPLEFLGGRYIRAGLSAPIQVKMENKKRSKLFGLCPICGEKTKGGKIEGEIMFYCTNKKCETMVYPGKLVQEAFKKI
jgi:hypothetical protein